MVKPVTAAGQNEVRVYFPGGAGSWYALDSMRLAGAREKALVVSAPLEKIPVFVRAGDDSNFPSTRRIVFTRKSNLLSSQVRFYPGRCVCADRQS